MIISYEQGNIYEEIDFIYIRYPVACILMSRENPHIDYTNQMLIINTDGRADSWVPSSSDVFAEDWEVVDE